MAEDNIVKNISSYLNIGFSGQAFRISPTLVFFSPVPIDGR